MKDKKFKPIQPVINEQEEEQESDSESVPVSIPLIA